MIINWRPQAARKYPSISGTVASTTAIAWGSFGSGGAAPPVTQVDRKNYWGLPLSRLIWILGATQCTSGN